MKLNFRKLLIATYCFGGVLFSAASMDASAHGGLSLDADKCKLRIGPHAMHFTGYQPQATGSKEFCEDIPSTGPTVVVMDAIDEPLRHVPIEVRIIRDTGDESNLEAVSVLHVPPKIYTTGSVSFEYQFDKPGKFVGLVTAHDKETYVSRFPFSVASTSHSLKKYIPFVGLLLVGLALFAYSGVGRSKKATDGAA